MRICQLSLAPRLMLRFALLIFFFPAALLPADQNPCERCHAAEVKAFQRSSMSRSVSAVASQPDGRVHHKLSGTTVTIRHDDQGGMLQHLVSDGLSAEYKVDYAVGAGKVGFSYVVSIPPFLFQSPVSFYSQEGVWDVTPGYEPERTLDFTHPIPEGCVFCHTNTANLRPGTDNQFNEPALTPISCERCHGPSAAHLQKPVPGSIVNPVKLPDAARDSVCEQCHLEGEVRILDPGKHWQNFVAGEETESVFSTYLVRVPANEGIKAVTQFEQLSLSRCARESGGRLWCGTCHNPHSDATDRAKEVRTACLGCHAQLFTAQKHQPAEECVSCHMPRIRPNNIAHAAITSHVIALPNIAAKAESPQPGGVALSAWRSPRNGFADRNLALAIFHVAAGKKDSSQILRAYEMLSHLRERDPEVLATLGSILLGQGYGDLAVSLYREAVGAAPNNARYAFVLGSAYASQGKRTAAIEELRRSISIDPSSPDPYRKLAEIYEKAGAHTQSLEVIGEYLKFMPQNLEFRRAQLSNAANQSVPNRRPGQ